MARYHGLPLERQPSTDLKFVGSTMSHLQLSVSEPLAAYAEQQAQARGFTDATAFVEHLIEADRRGAVRMQIELAA